MKQRNWKKAFGILAALNLLILAAVLFLARPTGEVKTEETIPKKGNIQIAMEADALRSVIDRGLSEAGIEGTVEAGDGIRLSMPVEAYGISSALSVRTEPRATKDGRIELAVKEAKLGQIPLPPAETVAMASRLFQKDGVAFDSARRSIVIDPAMWAIGGIRDLKAIEMNAAEGRYIFEGTLGE